MVYGPSPVSFLGMLSALNVLLLLSPKPGFVMIFPLQIIFLLVMKFLSDRNLTGSKQKGSGVLVAIDCSLESVRSTDLESQRESVWLEVGLKKGKKLLIRAFYIAPDVSPTELNHSLLPKTSQIYIQTIS